MTKVPFKPLPLCRTSLHRESNPGSALTVLWNDVNPVKPVSLGRPVGGTPVIDELAIIALLAVPGIGRKTVHRLLARFSEAHSAGPLSARGLLGLLQEAKSQGARVRVPSLSELEAACRSADDRLATAQHLGIQVIGFESPDFPAQLRNIPDPPVVLYVKGDLSCLRQPAIIAIVGTRKPTPFGLQTAQCLGKAVAEREAVVVSGLARGCDTAAHRGCLAAGGTTVAVLAHGLDAVYPPENKGLADIICESHGCLVSEYPPGTGPQKHHFIERDRLQSGLSSAVIVVETGASSGAMHTASFCVEQGRLLGCVMPPPEFGGWLETQGNRTLVDAGKAVPLGTGEDLDAFVDRVFRVLPGPNPWETSSLAQRGTLRGHQEPLF